MVSLLFEVTGCRWMQSDNWIGFCESYIHGANAVPSSNLPLYIYQTSHDTYGMSVDQFLG